MLLNPGRTLIRQMLTGRDTIAQPDLVGRLADAPGPDRHAGRPDADHGPDRQPDTRRERDAPADAGPDRRPDGRGARGLESGAERMSGIVQPIGHLLHRNPAAAAPHPR